MFVLGVASQVLFSAWAMGELWQGGRHTEATTPTLYMPTVGGCFVSAIACGTFGIRNLGYSSSGQASCPWSCWN